MARKANYLNVELFEPYFRELKNRKATFSVEKTTYTRKIKTDKFILMFNSNGRAEYKTLGLINSVRRDADKYLKEGKPLGKNFINYFDMFQIPSSKEIITKIDIKSAYWSYSIMEGIISGKTDQQYLDLFKGYRADIAKVARLKALGCLATKKIICDYKDGKKIDSSEKVITQKTRPLYIDICRNIDRVMSECAEVVEGVIYYYWDCIFVKQKFNKDVIEFFKHKGYDTTIGNTQLEYVEIGDAGWLVSLYDNKSYMTRKENKHLIWTPEEVKL